MARVAAQFICECGQRIGRVNRCEQKTEALRIPIPTQSSKNYFYETLSSHVTQIVRERVYFSLRHFSNKF